MPRAFRCMPAGAAANTPITAPASAWPMCMLDLKRRRPDVRAFVAALEAWIIGTLGGMQVRGERREDRVGVWVRRPERPPLPDGAPAEDKIAAIGIRLRRWVTFHGISLNVDPDLGHFSGIVPCGIRGLRRDQPRRSRPPGLHAGGRHDAPARFEAIFGPTVDG